MKCKRCGDSGATRMEEHFASEATVTVYLCSDCAERETRRQDVSGLEAATNR